MGEYKNNNAKTMNILFVVDKIVWILNNLGLKIIYINLL